MRFLNIFGILTEIVVGSLLKVKNLLIVNMMIECLENVNGAFNICYEYTIMWCDPYL